MRRRRSSTRADAGATAVAASPHEGTGRASASGSGRPGGAAVVRGLRRQGHLHPPDGHLPRLAEQAPATHCNPDPIARHADLSVKGGPARRVLFPTTFHGNNFWGLTVPLTLKKGTNRLTFTADELPDFNGDTYNQYEQRSPYAPVIDRIAVTPLAEK